MPEKIFEKLKKNIPVIDKNAASKVFFFNFPLVKNNTKNGVKTTYKQVKNALLTTLVLACPIV